MRSNEIAVKVLVVDVGGSHVKCVTTDQKQPARFKSGMKLTPQRMMKKLLEAAAGPRSYAAPAKSLGASL